MLHSHSMFAFSPELGDSDKGSQKFYPERSVQKRIISEDFHTVKYFLKMHIPQFRVIKEESNLPSKKFIVALPDKEHKNVKAENSIFTKGRKGFRLETFQASISDLRKVRLIFLFKKAKFNGNEKSLEMFTSRDLPFKGSKKVKLTHFKGGFMTEEVDILRRTFNTFEFEQNLGETNEFVLLVEKRKKLIGRLVHVLELGNVANLLRGNLSQ
jgi:hypothetical protein